METVQSSKKCKDYLGVIKLIKNRVKGTFMLWVDVELAWGLVHVKKIDALKVRRLSLNVREILGSVINLLERYKIPVTWAILGHLLLDYCSKDNMDKLPHRDMPRSSYSWLNCDWYKYDPCTDIQRDPAWYGKDIADTIVKYVRESGLSHDVGCHSFSHQQFGDPGCSKELARAEIQKCIELMKGEYGIVPRVFAFPRDYVGHLDVLKEFGFVGYRDTPPKLNPCLKLERTLPNLINTYASLFVQFLSYYLLLPPHVVAPRKSLSGLWSVPGCLPYSEKRMIPLRLVTLKAIKGIDRAIREGTIFTMYTHLRNFGENKSMLSHFQHVLSYVDRKRAEGVLEVKTMEKLIEQLNCQSHV